jgi:hypothetical protein
MPPELRSPSPDLLGAVRGRSPASGGGQDAEDLLTLLQAGTLARLQSGGKGPTIGEGGPEVDVRDRTPLVRVHPFSILNRQGVLAILALPLRQASGPLKAV